MIGIINYGLGNINAIKNIYDEYNIKTHEISSEDSFKPEIKKIILPGVGSFDNAINNLKEFNLFQKLLEFSKVKKNYLLGICVGMQILANKSEEGTQKGLGIIPGKIVKFNSNYVTPNMGWHTINMKSTNLIFKNISNQSKFYFLHSYYFEPDNQNHILSDTIYYKKFPSIVFNKNIFGIQFHPEKSHDDGKKILLNFYNL